MKCILCRVSKEKGEGRQRWVFSSEQVPMTKASLLFKLYDYTKKEFPAGSVCPVCFDLIAQIGSLEFQMLEAQKALKSRVNCCATPEDYISAHANDSDYDELDNDSDLCKEGTDSIPVARKRPLTSRKRHQRDSQLLKARVKREKPDYDEYEDENHDEDEDDEEDDDGGDNVESQLDMSRYLSVEHIKKEKEDGLDADAKKAFHEKKGINRSPENLDFDLTITRTTRGHDQLVYEGYTYLKTTHQPAGDIARWKCTSYYATKTGCRAKLHTTMDGFCVLLDSKTEHNHPPPDERQLKIILFREQVKQIANNHPEMKPTEILTNARMLLDTPTSLGLKDESIMRYIQRIKSKHRLEKQQQQQQVQQQDHPQPEEQTLEEPQEPVQLMQQDQVHLH